MPDINQNTEYGGGAILNRFAISALSKKYKDQALNEEIMVDKTTGEFLIKSPNGTLMSFDAINRRRSTINDATDYALMQNMYGNMYEVKIDGLILPEPVAYDTEILSEPVTLKSNLKKVLFFIDLDEIVVDGDVGEATENEPIVTIKILCKAAGKSKEITIQKELKDINNNVIDVASNINFGNSSYTTRIESLSFKKNTSDNVNSVLILQNLIVSLY